MLVPSDYKELLKTLNKRKVRYLVVGAYAVIYYTEPRYTKDLDIWVEPEKGNAQKVYNVLKEFGAPLRNILPRDFTNKYMVYQIGVAPVRVDILMGLGDIPFVQAWKNRKIANFEGIKINIIGLNELITAKAKVRRRADKADIDNLRMKLKKQL
jgi:predicted nucleotidyltransferase